jgi:hypothetical protein
VHGRVRTTGLGRGGGKQNFPRRDWRRDVGQVIESALEAFKVEINFHAIIS